MTNNRVIPTPQPSDLPTFKILISGTAINAAYQVMAVDISKAFNKISSAGVTLIDGQASSESFTISNSDDFKPGNEIEIQAGYHNDNSTVFKGIIIRHGVKFRKNKPSYLHIEAKDKAVKMSIGRKSAYFYDNKDSDIIETIAGNYSLDKDVEATDITHKEMVQFYTTDWDFTITRAEMNGKLVLTDDNKLIVKKPDTSSATVLTLENGATLMEFEADMDARYQYSSVKGHSWIYADQELIEAEAAAPSFTENGNLSSSDLAGVIGLSEFSLRHSGRIKDDELQKWSDAQMLKSKLCKIRGRAKFQGLGSVKPGNMVELKGCGDRFNGNVFVTGVRHQIDTKNWETDIQFGFAEDWFYEKENIVEKTASGLVAGINGLQIGVVVKLESDPDGEDRIQVRVPLISTSDDGIWARVATLDAGKDRGSFFRPEIGDEVIVGFINDDPRHAIVLGMLNSSNKPAPLQAQDANNQKGFFTREKMKLLFDDDKKSITILTPAGKTIVLDEDAGAITIKDENNNKIEMSSSGINIESGSDLTLKATGTLTAQGATANFKSDGDFKAEGSGSIEVSSSGIAKLKGSMVQIN
jgi:Rhs element Vgr protein